MSDNNQGPKSFSYNLINDDKAQKENSLLKELIALKMKEASKDDDKPVINNDENLTEKMWDEIEKQIESGWQTYMKPQSQEESDNDKKIVNCIRVFVSSTFTDFFSERESLIKKVFPKLRAWCSERGLDLIECDLRWGVPQDTTSDETILTCLNELDRCYKENDGQPFFIGMLGERYGWVPDMGNLAIEIKERYNWIPKISITFMEFLHGFLRSKNKNACVFIRSKDSLDHIPTEFHNKFYETDPLSILQLKKEKKKLKQLHPDRVFEYSCKYEGTEESTGRKKVKLGNLEEFEEKAYNFLTSSIENFYPDLKVLSNREENESFEAKERDEREMDYQKLYINEKLHFYIEPKVEIDLILKFINKEDSIKLEDDQAPPSYRSLVVRGDEGYGKSSLLAFLVKYLVKNGFSVFYHFCDASIKSQSSIQMVRLFLKFFSQFINLEEIISEFESRQAMGSNNSYKAFDDACLKMSNLDEKLKIVIIIDDVEQFSKNEYPLNIPRNLPPNITLIVSCRTDSNNVEKTILSDETWYKLTLSYMDIPTTKAYIEKYLGKYNKRLDEKQTSLMLDKPISSRIPLWLSFACNELRIFGEFSTVTKKIQEMPPNLFDLIKYVINRIDSEFHDNLIIETLCLLHASEKGIPENEAAEILSSFFDNNISIDKLTWSQIVLLIKPFVLFSQLENSQIIKLAHERLHKIINEALIAGREKNIEQYHLKLIDFYKNKSKYRKYSVFRLCYHYSQVKKNSEYVDFLRSRETFMYINYVERSRLFKRIRCPRMIGMNATAIEMCSMCSMNHGPNFMQLKDSCYICGSVVHFNVSSNLAGFCMVHNQMGIPNNMYKCVICNQLKPYNATHQMFKAVKAKICSWCLGGNICCAIDGVNKSIF